jgi:hypothetical protein
VSLGVFLEPLYGFVYEVILLQLFCCISLHYFTWISITINLCELFLVGLESIFQSIRIYSPSC